MQCSLSNSSPATLNCSSTLCSSSQNDLYKPAPNAAINDRKRTHLCHSLSSASHVYHLSPTYIIHALYFDHSAVPPGSSLPPPVVAVVHVDLPTVPFQLFQPYPGSSTLCPLVCLVRRLKCYIMSKSSTFSLIFGNGYILIGPMIEVKHGDQ